MDHNKIKSQSNEVLFVQTSQNTTKNLVSYIFEISLIEKFKACFEEETLNNEHFQVKLLELSTVESDNFQGNEFLIKRMMETRKDCQFEEMKENLFNKFNVVLNGIRKHPTDDI